VPAQLITLLGEALEELTGEVPARPVIERVRRAERRPGHRLLEVLEGGVAVERFVQQ
jgi:hypothetical protein